MKRLWFFLVGALVLAGCVRRPPPVVGHPHYLVGASYEVAGTWFYPRESFRYDQTGLAERLPDRVGLTADGEAFDWTAMAAAHQTLQLPAIARVTDLETGRQVLVRINDRGPSSSGRIIGLTRRAADLLGVPPSGAAQVRVEVDDIASQALRDQLGGGPAGITAAPRGAVTAEALAPPVGGSSGRGRVATPLSQAQAESVEASVPDRLPETVQQVPAQRGVLWITLGQFSQPAYANALRAKVSGLQAEVRHEGGGRSPIYAVRAGPFTSVADTDAALDQARAAGVTDARIVVE